MATQRRDFAGTGKIWVNGTLFSESAKISTSIGGKLNRVVTTGYTGETSEDPTMCEINVDGSVLRRQSYLERLRRYRQSQEDVTIKVQVGTNLITARAKVGPLKLETENGKSTFSTSFMGDEQ